MMKNFLIKYRIKIIFTVLGALGGFLYWKFVGCSSGTCPITSHWYTMGSYGIIMSYLIGDMITGKPKKNNETAAGS